jgi:hypothetical protein
MALARRLVIGSVIVSLVASFALVIVAFAPAEAYASCTPYHGCSDWAFVGSNCGCEPCKEWREWHRICSETQYDCTQSTWIETKWTCEYWQWCCG